MTSSLLGFDTLKIEFSVHFHFISKLTDTHHVSLELSDKPAGLSLRTKYRVPPTHSAHRTDSQEQGNILGKAKHHATLDLAYPIGSDSQKPSTALLPKTQTRSVTMSWQPIKFGSKRRGETRRLPACHGGNTRSSREVCPRNHKTSLVHGDSRAVHNGQSSIKQPSPDSCLGKQVCLFWAAASMKWRRRNDYLP